jgi:gamma-glutamylcyclotransferase (GGCT)/AIG2-like uncharacterized protein YtfP
MHDCRHLFVYGTLMRSARTAFGAPQRQRLAAESRSLGAARAPGALYDLGSYPGLVVTHAPQGVVHGEVVALEAPAATFSWLDVYEGIGSPGAAIPGDGEYERGVLTVTLAGGDELSCWAYIYIGPLARAREVPGGRWLAPTG